METTLKTSGRKKRYALAFLAGLLPFLLTAVSFAVQSGGIFYMNGDFNSQQLPFTFYISRNIRALRFPEFDFSAGAGLDYINAYSFYGLFSPFTLIYALFPDSLLPYAAALVIALKFGVCGLSAYIYISRYCKTEEYALIGALLYAYSGYVMITLMFHYLDALAFFPLMLAALESAVNEKRRGVFGAAVFLCAAVNYYIFGMAAIFIVIYFILRHSDKSFRITVKDFFCLAAETVLGIMAAGIVIVPAVVYMLNSPRLGEPFGSIRDMLLYETPWRYGRILQAMFTFPDQSGNTNIFPDLSDDYPYGSMWSSLAMYVPMFGISGALAFALADRKSWLSRLFAVCVVMAFVPVLNGLFSMGSSLYYARWMFAPTLMISLMTACALENDPRYFKAGLAAEAAAIVLLAAFSVIFPIESLARWEAMASYSNVQKWIDLSLSAVGILSAFVMLLIMKRDSTYPQKLLVVAAAFAFAFSEITMLFSRGETDDPELYAQSAYSVGIDKESPEGSRVNMSSDLDNRNILWGTSSPFFFTSIVTPYLDSYCRALDIEDAGMRKDISVQCLMSVKDLIMYYPAAYGEDREFIENIPEALGYGGMFTYNGADDMYFYYENRNYIPMGFCYEYCISEEDILALDKDIRGRLMLKAMVVEDTDEVSEYLAPIPKEEIYALDDEELSAECAKRAEISASHYFTDDDSYNAEIELDEPELVFFSVAYDKGFTAYVDGEEVPLIKANFGFQAIPVPEGRHTVRCVYHSVPRDIGAACSAAGIIGSGVYIAVCIKLRRKKSV